MEALKARLLSGERLAGCFVMIPAPAIVEMVAHAGFDFVVLDTEHGAAGGEMLEHLLRAADGAGIAALVRTVGMSAGEILRVLDAGACGVVVPHVRSAADARAIVAAAHYPPHGIRGLATTARAGRHGFTTVAEHLAKARAETIVMPQIEDADALDHVGAIASVEGVDSVFIGPADLSLSLGHPGDPSHPVVAAAIERAVGEIKAAGKVPASFARSAADLAVFRTRGVPVSVFSSTTLIGHALAETGRALDAERSASAPGTGRS